MMGMASYLANLQTGLCAILFLHLWSGRLKLMRRIKYYAPLRELVEYVRRIACGLPESFETRAMLADVSQFRLLFFCGDLPTRCISGK